MYFDIFIRFILLVCRSVTAVFECLFGIDVNAISSLILVQRNISANSVKLKKKYNYYVLTSVGCVCLFSNCVVS